MYFIYGATHGSTTEAARMYGERFPQKQLPKTKRFADLLLQLYETGSFLAFWSDVCRTRNARAAGI